jgi:putative two-component system response regulator
MTFKDILDYSKSLTVLYAEDDIALNIATSEILGDLFKKVYSVQNGQEALQIYNDYYKENGSFIDIVITDINMPVMDGEKLIQEINKINEKNTIIVISAYNESSRLINLIHLGINNFVMKPIEHEQFIYILYKTSKAVYNEKNILKYQLELEELNKNLDDKVKVQAKEILLTQKVAIEAITRMIEEYDDDTGTHVKRIEAYSYFLCSKLNKDEQLANDIVESIGLASLLHDIGKLMISKDILNKPGKLDSEEFEHIKQHSSVGGKILEEANKIFYDEFKKDSFLKMASLIAYHHHEKWDGSGYPDGLKGEEIPLCARIVSIADVYDAIRSKRVYKEAISHEEAVEIIRGESGKSFDPKLVDIFLKYHKDFDDIFNKL